MNYGLKLLKKELKRWKKFYQEEKAYYKGYENDPMAITSFDRCTKIIESLTKEVMVLEQYA